MGASNFERNALHSVVATSESSIVEGALPKFIETKSETFFAEPSDAEQATKCQRQEVISKGSQQTSSSSTATADTTMQILNPKIPKFARPLSLAVREDCPKTSETCRSEHRNSNWRKRQQKRDFFTDGRSECTTHSESEWTSQDGQVWCGTVSSDSVFFAGTPKFTTLRAFLTIASIHGKPVASGDCHSAFHQSPMPSDAEPLYVEPAAPEAQLDSSKVWLCKKAFQGLTISPQALGIVSTEDQRHELKTVGIRSFDIREETCSTI